MREEMPTATFTRQSKFSHRTTFRSKLCSLRQIHQSIRVLAFIGNPVLLYERNVGVPLPRDGEVTGIAANRNWEVHVVSLV